MLREIPPVYAEIHFAFEGRYRFQQFLKKKPYSYILFANQYVSETVMK